MPEKEVVEEVTAPAVAEKLEGDEPRQLLDMRLVLSGPKVVGETYRVRELRKYYKDSRRQFMAEMAKLEGQLLELRGRRNAVVPEGGEGARAPDVGSGTAVGALEKFLEGWTKADV
jgi:hypothetical protein